MSLKGKYALITGSSRGIGRAIALKLARMRREDWRHYYKNIDAANDTLEKYGSAALMGSLFKRM